MQYMHVIIGIIYISMHSIHSGFTRIHGANIGSTIQVPALTRDAGNASPDKTLIINFKLCNVLDTTELYEL
jgi:hypothetical protein